MQIGKKNDTPSSWKSLKDYKTDTTPKSVRRMKILDYNNYDLDVDENDDYDMEVSDDDDFDI